MTLRAGDRLSVYEILAPLGAGAMGEVWRARDTRLGREVAVKVLPDHFAGDEERLQRFEREARALASLNHPNVAQIYGVDQVGDTCFLVLELVPGETLAERLARGALPVAEALEIARQIAEGLEAAHEAGVIHRDLKPANVRLTPDGKVKVLDFGLARHAGGAGSPGSSSDSVLSTAAGRLLGTPTYMAPEQARGKSIDKRVDVWAFGCVLYECLTGKRAFDGETLTDVLGAVLHAEADLSALPTGTPRRVRDLVASCLEKDPRQRLRDVGDARRELARTGDAPPEPAAARPARLRSLWLGAGVALLAVAGAYFLGHASRSAAPPGITLLDLPLEPADQLGTSSGSRPSRPALAITSDGRRVVFIGGVAGAAGETTPAAASSAVASADGASAPATPPAEPKRVYVRALDAGEAVPLAGTEGADTLFLSPDDRWVGFFADGEILKVPLDGGPVARIAKLTDGGLPSASALVPAERDFFGACFDTDGAVVFGRYRDGLWEVPAGSVVPRRLTDAPSGGYHRLPHLLPDGRGLLLTEDFFRHPRVCVVPRAGGERRILMEEATDARFVPPDRLVFARDGVLMSAPFDLERAEVTGPPTALVSNLLHAYDGARPGAQVLTAFFDVSASGTLVFAEGGRIPIPPSRLVWVARDGTVEPLAAPPGYYARPRLAPDGRRIVVSHAAAGRRSIDTRNTVLDLERGTMARLVDEEGWWGPLWSSDGARILSGRRSSTWSGVGSMAADGSSVPEEPLALFPDAMASSVSSDGAWLFVVTSDEGGGSDITRVALAGRAEPEPLIHTRANEAWPELSPDGALLAYGSDTSGQFEVYVQPYPGPGPRQQVSVDGGGSPLWSRDGRELYYYASRSGRIVELMAADVARTPALTIGQPRLLFAGPYQSLGGLTSFDVAPDGQRFLMIEQLETPETPIPRLRVVLDWLPEMRPLPEGSNRP